MKIVDERETQQKTPKDRKEQGGAEAIVKGWEVNDFVVYFRVRLIFLKCCHENLSFCWVMFTQHIFLAHRTLYFRLYFTVAGNKFIVWTYCFSDLTDICSNSTILTVE